MNLYTCFLTFHFRNKFHKHFYYHNPFPFQIHKFCKLNYEESCLDFHKNKSPVKTLSMIQVRKPIYKNTQDNSGLEGSFSWQATPHINWEAWVGNQLAAGRTVANTALPGLDETFFGLRFKWTGRPVIFKKQNVTICNIFGLFNRLGSNNFI